MNAKDYGIPQNRERCFCISILSDDFIDFEFPEPVELEKVMKDYLEESVDEKYYINNEKADKLIQRLLKDGVLESAVVGGFQEHQIPRTDGISPALTASMGMGGGQIPVFAESKRRQSCKTIDLCVKKPREINISNCICARYDCGISNLQSSGTGVVEWK